MYKTLFMKIEMVIKTETEGATYEDNSLASG